MRKRIDPVVRVRAVQLVREHQDQYPTVTAAVIAVAKQLDVSRESVRRWVAQDEVDAGGRPGVTSAENAEIKRLRAENKKMQEKVDILRAATVFFAACGQHLSHPPPSPAGRALGPSDPERARQDRA